MDNSWDQANFFLWVDSYHGCYPGYIKKRHAVFNVRLTSFSDGVANTWHCGYYFIAAITDCILQVRNWTMWSKIWMK